MDCALPGSYDWIAFFRREDSFFVPVTEADQWLEMMVGCVQFPRWISGGPALAGHRTIPARDRANQQQKAALGSSPPDGEIFFDYEGHVLSEDAQAASIPLVPQRKKILRDEKSESLARQKFEEAGFKKQRDSGEFRLVNLQARMPGAVRDLVAAGWRVEAEGKLFRNPDSFKLRISAGIDWFELHGRLSSETHGLRFPVCWPL